MAETTTATQTLVGFEVGGVSYAVPIARVSEIIRPLPMQTLPHAPKMVVGVSDHRGYVVPVIDLRVRFEITQQRSDREARWIIVQRAGRPVGLVVDKVTEVFTVPDARAREVPDLGSGAEQRGIVTAHSHQGRLIFVIDVDSVSKAADAVETPALLPEGP